jgi:hypothetical protein
MINHNLSNPCAQRRRPAGFHYWPLDLSFSEAQINAHSLRVQFRAAKIVARILKDGWVSESGAKHEKFSRPASPGVKIMVPRHKTLSPGVARNIAKAAGW